jgi:chromate transporter
MLGLSLLYVTLGTEPLIAGVFFGVKAVVLAIVLEALIRIARRSLKRPLEWGLAAAAFLALFLFDLPFPLVVLGAGLIGFSLQGASAQPLLTGQTAPPSLIPIMRSALLWLGIWAAPVALAMLTLGPNHTLSQMGVFFGQLAMVTFGGAYAALSYVAQEAVSGFGWLSTQQMMHGLGLAETTPGPLVLVLQFVGFLGAYANPEPFSPILAGVLASLLVLWVTFAPSFLWIFCGAPYLEAITNRPRLAGALSAITASVVGVILNLAIWFALHVLFGAVERVAVGPLQLWRPELASFNASAFALAVLSAVLLLRLKAGLLTTLALGGAIGAGLALAGQA